MEKLPIYNIVLGDADGILKMSLVDVPAVESNFLAFAKQEPLKFAVDDEQHIVFGCALRADFPIYRKSDSLGEFYVTFSKETVKQLYEKFMIEGLQNLVNLMHNTDVDGCYLIQSFIKDEEAGLSPKGFEDVQNGSWFCSYKITNEKIWQAVKDGLFRGFSVEGVFDLEEKTEQRDEIEDLIDELLKN